MTKIGKLTMTFYKFLLVVLITYNIISFSAGLYPFKENILNKKFYPKNDSVKYTIMSSLLFVMSLFMMYTYYFILKRCDVDVLLSKA